MTKNKVANIEELIKEVSTYIKDDNELDKIRKGYNFAYKAHIGQFRKSGEPYILHPLNTALILTTVYADSDTIVAGLLHDTIEDCNITKEEIEKEFNKTVANLVYGVSKLGRINFSTENEYLIDYYKKIIVGMSEDVRVIIVKLADRLHNMRTLYALPKEKQKKISKETLEILAPIGDHLGIHKIKSELEDLSLRYLKPDVFYEIADNLDQTKLERDISVNNMLNEVSKLLKEHNIKHEIKGRSKSIYSIYNKLNKGKKFNEIYDLLALRILVDTKEECYLAIGIIHSKFKPIPKRFKDYIAMPKANMYQSLHTTVFGLNGEIFEIQIRTHKMDEVAENGIASHWAYKEHKDAKDYLENNTEKKLQFFKSIIELNEEKMSSEDFVNSVKDDVLSNNNIYCFTPKGDIIELPKGSTPIDFAYKVHSAVGDSMVGAIVNNNIVPLDYVLKSNDIVKINTNKQSKGPSMEWINICKTNQAKNKIKSFFTKSEKELYIERGKLSIEKELRKRKIPFNTFFSDLNTDKLFKELKINDLEDLYLFIGNGKYQPGSIVNIIYKKEEEPVKKKIVIRKDLEFNSDILVSGIDKVKVNFSNCCNPIPEDAIIGYITKGNGISIHRKNCHNLEYLDDRTVNISWNKETHELYLTTIQIHTKTKDNNLLDLVQKLSMQDIRVDKVITINNPKNIIYELDMYVKNLTHLNKAFNELNKLSYVSKIERVIR